MIVVLLLFGYLPYLSTAQNIYTAQYRARFQHSLDPGCSFNAPVFQVGCRGTILVTRTSSQTIVCNTASQQDEAGFSFVQCRTTCPSANGCAADWLNNVYGIGVRLASFGEIDFECFGDGDSQIAIEAFASIEDGGDGECDSPTILEPRRASLHVAQLGVQCDNAYQFEETIFQCGGQSEEFSDDFGELDGFTCSSGGGCGFLLGNCGIVEFERVIVRSIPAVFDDGCYDRTSGPSTSMPLPAPVSGAPVAPPASLPTGRPVSLPTNVPVASPVNNAPSTNPVPLPTTIPDTTLQPNVPTTTNSDPPSDVAKALQSNSSDSQTGAIVGGVLGGLAIIFAAILAIVFIRRRQRSSARGISLGNEQVANRNDNDGKFPQVPIVLEEDIEVPQKADQCDSILYEQPDREPVYPPNVMPTLAEVEDESDTFLRDEDQCDSVLYGADDKVNL